MRSTEDIEAQYIFFTAAPNKQADWNALVAQIIAADTPTSFQTRLAKSILQNYSNYLLEMIANGRKANVRASRIYLSDMREYKYHLSETQKKIGGIIVKLQDEFALRMWKADQPGEREWFQLTRNFRIHSYTRGDDMSHVFKRIRSSFLENPGTSQIKLCGPSGMDLDYLDDLFVTPSLAKVHRLYTLEALAAAPHGGLSVPVAFAYFSEIPATPGHIKLELLCAKSDKEVEIQSAAAAAAGKPSLAKFLMRRALIDMLGTYMQFSLEALNLRLLFYYRRNFGFQVIPTTFPAPHSEDEVRVAEVQLAVNRILREAPNPDVAEVQVQALQNSSPIFEQYFASKRLRQLVLMHLTDFTKIRALLQEADASANVSEWLATAKVSLFDKNVPLGDFVLPARHVAECIQCHVVKQANRMMREGQDDTRSFCNSDCQEVFYHKL